MERKKLELEINKSQKMQLLYDSYKEGESTYGKWFMYGVRSNGEEYNFFAPLQVHDAIKHLQKNSEIVVTKVGKQQGKKLVTEYLVEILNGKKEGVEKPNSDGYYEAMLKSYEDASRIQNKFSAVNLNQCSISIFIARTKSNGFNNFYKE